MNDEIRPGISTRYKPVRTIGSGGMGIVHQAIDLATGDTVALKLLHPQLTAQPAFVERFKNELLLARRITHKNVCRVFDFHQFSDGVVIAMEYVDGETLASLLERERPSLEQTLSIIGQVVEGLAEAHAQGVVHHDITPSNIMISRDGVVKVMDFGVSQTAESKTTVSSRVYGTPRYMAPEQFKVMSVDARADIYSVGLILYEMLTGHSIIRGEQRAPFEVPEIEAIVSKCLQEGRARRYQNASELARALPPITRITPTNLRHSRNWRLMFAVPALVILALVFINLRSVSTSEIPIRQHSLQNGLRVILSEDHAAPTYSIAIAYNVGSRNERPGETGYTHLLEHLMFQGSENVGKGEHAALVANNGGNVNGSTTADYTMFFETLPANQLDLGLFMEADRMRSLVIDQPNLDSQRATVEEERRQRAGNEPYGKTWEAVYDLAFDNFAYRHPVIGSIEDLARATVKGAAEFFRMHYTPGNAILSLVGDFNSADALARIEKYFGKMPAQPRPAEPDVSEAARKSERRQTIEDPFAARERIDIAFKIPPANSTDFVALDVLSDLLLTNGSDGRLYQRLIKESEVAVSAGFLLEPHRGPSLARFTGIPRPGKSAAQLERLFSEEIHRLRTESVTQPELDRVRRQHRRLNAQRYKNTVNRAQDIARFAIVFGDPGLIKLPDAERI